MRQLLIVIASGMVAFVVAACSVGGGGGGERDGAVPAPDGVGVADGGEILIAGASDLQPAFTELGAMFTETTGIEVTFDFGSSGQLAQRIIEGQPVDLFASASAGFVDRVVDAGVGDVSTRRTYAYGRIVLWSDAERWAGWADLPAAVVDDEVVNFAIANPEHAPYGTAGQQALEATGVLDDVADRLVLGENISDTLRLIETGNADVGIVALSLAVAGDERGVGAWILLDEDLHEPLQQDLIVTTADPRQAELAARFVDFVEGDEGRALMRRAGFLLPGEEGAG